MDFMNDDALTVKVSKDIEDLIPAFLANRKKEVETLRAALAAGDFEQLRQVGHRMRGVGHSYGFDRGRSAQRRQGCARSAHRRLRPLPFEPAGGV
jgi:HPt (histidine-containing phosphotransfer) domain-containing protein